MNLATGNWQLATLLQRRRDEAEKVESRESKVEKMTKPIQEALPAGADAIPRATVEFTWVNGKWQVRGKDRQGYAFRQEFTDPDLAMEYFWQKPDSLDHLRF